MLLQTNRKSVHCAANTNNNRQGKKKWIGFREEHVRVGRRDVGIETLKTVNNF